MALTAKQQAFVEAYCGNATEAALKAGYSPKTAYSQGQRLLKNDEVKAAQPLFWDDGALPLCY